MGASVLPENKRIIAGGTSIDQVEPAARVAGLAVGIAGWGVLLRRRMLSWPAASELVPTAAPAAAAARSSVHAPVLIELDAEFSLIIRIPVDASLRRNRLAIV